MEKVGEHYDRLMRVFLDLGGDPSSCPFDAVDYVYEGPVLVDGEMVRAPSSPGTR